MSQMQVAQQRNQLEYCMICACLVMVLSIGLRANIGGLSRLLQAFGLPIGVRMESMPWDRCELPDCGATLDGGTV